MSYTKYSPDTPPDILTFYYEKSAMFNNISLRTMYRAKSLLNDKGEAMNDQYSMSEDETDAFLVFMEDAINDAFQAVLKMTTQVDNALIVDATVTIALGETVDNCYGFIIVDEAAYNENNLFSVDDGVKKYLQYHIMASWWGLVGHEAEEAKWLVKRDAARADLITNRLFQLRKNLIS